MDETNNILVVANRYKNDNLLSRQFKGQSDYCECVRMLCIYVYYNDEFMFVYFSEAGLSVLRRQCGVVVIVSWLAG